jgi:hypothetical protein
MTDAGARGGAGPGAHHRQTGTAAALKGNHDGNHACRNDFAAEH